MKQYFENEKDALELGIQTRSQEDQQTMKLLTVRRDNDGEKMLTEESQTENKELTREEIRKLMEEEKRMGLSTRCEWCPENIFCSAYLLHVKKKPDEIPRCNDLFSGR